MSDEHLQQGYKAEQWARRWLEQQGLILLESNWHCRQGEIDLIMQHESVICFVEVRFRRNNAFGGALASVTPAKQSRLVQTASQWLAEHPYYADNPCRFDIMALQKDQGSQQEMRVHWLQNAFQGEDS